MLTLTITELNGRLSVEPNSKNGLELGKISPADKKTGMICVKNKTTLEIKLGGWRSPCACLDLDEPAWELSPGTESKSNAILDGSAYRGSFEKNMHISFSAKDLETVNFFLPVKFAVIEVEKSVVGDNSDGKGISASDALQTASKNEIQDEKSLLVKQVEMDAKEFNPNDRKSVFVFAGRTCPGCNYMRRVLGPKLLGKYGIRSGQVALLDLEKPENMLILANLEEKLGCRGTKTPVVFFNGMIMYGKTELEAEIERSPSDTPGKKTAEAKPIVIDMSSNDESMKSVRRKAEGITIGVIAMAGLIDGVNPCVFAGLVFLASLLASSRMGGRKVLVIGAAYCLGSFICYFLMGLGFMGIINSLIGGGGLPRTLLNGGMSAVLCVFSILSFRDAVIFKRNGTGAGMSLKLPDSLRTRIRGLMREGTRGSVLWAGAFGAGALVTVIESACTGQIYVPVLAFLSKMEGVLNVWLAYLFLYNVMFILPLVCLLLAVYFGISSLRLASLTRVDAFTGKILMGALFASLAILMILL